MASFIPITLVGKNLGERHRHLNALVSDAYQKKVSFHTIQDAPEHSAVDRLFKIDLASKLRHLEYVLASLKDDDMLYVSRALHSTWLLEPQYRDVINPAHLESVLFPEMTTTAVNKMNNWLHVHLKDSSRCLEFFQYYFPKNMDLALKFLWNCPEDVIAETILKIPSKITPKRLKLLCEKCPRAVRIYYDLLPKSLEALYEYSQDEEQYYLCLTNLINTDSDLLLDIAENYYNKDCCDSFSSTVTRVIMNKHKDRFVRKPELYAAYFLHLPTLAKCLNSDEIKDLVLRLSRAEYLGSHYFSYKRVEPLIKRLDQRERAAFKKVVFTDKSTREKVKDWPYEPPSSPLSKSDYWLNVFVDKIYEPRNGHHSHFLASGREETRINLQVFRSGHLLLKETLLEKLFNKYRCISFKNTFLELSKKIPTESSVQAREYMMLVLVSKTGGHAENLKDLLQLLITRHINEAENFRATIVRGLVKRAKVWQLPSDLWHQFLKFAHGLGLDSEQSTENCDEGLHAVVLRSILLGESCTPKVFSAFIKKFSTFAEYKLKEDEKHKVVEKLPILLLSSAKEQICPNEAVTRLEALMKFLNDYNLKKVYCSELVSTISAIAQEHPKPCERILKQLYEARFARKDLYRVNFTFLQSNESYLNVLRHDSDLLANTDIFEKQASEKIDHDVFLRKLAIYFSESNGLAANYLSTIEREMAKNPRADLCRSFAILAGSSLLQQLQQVDGIPEKTSERKSLAIGLRSLGHLTRPKLDLQTLGWRTAGLKAVTNQISICSISKAEKHMKALLEWPRAARLTFTLAEKIGCEADILAVIARGRPNVAIRITLCYIKQRGEEYDPKVWAIARSLLENIDLQSNQSLRDTLTHLEKVPESLIVDYGTVVFKALKDVSRDKAMRMLVNIEEYLQKADEELFVDVIQEYLEEELNVKNCLTVKYERNKYLMMRMIAKYLLLCKSEDSQKRKMETIGKRFLCVMKTFYDDAVSDEEKSMFRNYWDSFMYTLKFTDVFIDTSYVSPLPVMQEIIEWLKEVMPSKKYFDVHATMYLTILYFKAIRQSVKNNKEIFNDKEKRNDIGVEIVGVIYGKYIAHEITQLKKQYFESIVVIYTNVLIGYLSACFYEWKTFAPFVSALIRGLLAAGADSAAMLLALKLYLRYDDLLKNEKSYNTLENLQGTEDKQLKFFLHAEEI